MRGAVYRAVGEIEDGELMSLLDESRGLREWMLEERDVNDPEVVAAGLEVERAERVLAVLDPADD